MHVHTWAHVHTDRHTCTYFLCVFPLPAKEVWVISWDANNYRSGTEGWTDEPQMNATLHGAVTAARTWEGTAFPCTALLSALLAPKQAPRRLFRGPRKGYSDLFIGQEKKEFWDRIIFFSLCMGGTHIFFFLLPWSFRCSNGQHQCWASGKHVQVRADEPWEKLDIAWNRNGSTEEPFGVKPQLSRSPGR